MVNAIIGLLWIGVLGAGGVGGNGVGSAVAGPAGLGRGLARQEAASRICRGHARSRGGRDDLIREGLTPAAGGRAPSSGECNRGGEMARQRTEQREVA